MTQAEEKVPGRVISDHKTDSAGQKQKPADQKPDSVRINRFLSMAGLCSRREADQLIEKGLVQIDGVTAGAGARVTPGQTVSVNGQVISGLPKRDVLIALNKPVGYVCSFDRKWGDQLVGDLIDIPERVFYIGRLDKDSEGLLLMTNRGDLLNKIMKSGNYHEKEYVVTVTRKVSRDFLKAMSEGVYLEELGQTTRPCKCEKTGPYEFHITLTQGLNRQIRRMCVTLGFHVRSLKRIRVMNIELGDLKPGKWRYLTPEETQELTALLEGSENNPELHHHS